MFSKQANTFFVSLTNSTYITDSEGSDTLNIGAAKDDIHIIFNINANGEYNIGDDKLYLVNGDTYNTWQTEGTLPTTGIAINDYDSIETINSNDDYKIANLATLKSDVAAWLTAANEGGANYTDVTSAIKSGDDVGELIAIYDRAANWTPSA